ncbi:MAG TPA: fumarylacetoacetate hydrolase family protein [Synergistales bacterium]|nr:fumarylacetoacetate hydrolase family protein [Synergistales bacterium]
MKYLRFMLGEEALQGITDGIGYVKEIRGDIGGDYELTGRQFPLEEISKYLPPSVPTKIIAVGRNYRAHAEEMGEEIPREPFLFLKAPSALIGHRENIVYPVESSRVDYEAELGLVISRKGRNIPPDHAGDFILGCCCFNDITARDFQKSEHQWIRAKSFDTFAPCGPWLDLSVEPHDLEIQMYRNGNLVQNSRTGDFIFPIPELVSFISRYMTLYPGDIIATGTPSGVGPVEPGDLLSVRIQGVGELQNRVIRGE